MCLLKIYKTTNAVKYRNVRKYFFAWLNYIYCGSIVKLFNLLKMKKILPFTLALMLSLFMFNCGSDDDNSNNDNNETSTNFLKIGDAEYELKDGIIEYWGDLGSGAKNFDVTLVDSELTNFEGEPFPENSVFTAIYFELFTNNSQDLSLGDYNYDEDSMESFTFDLADIMVEYDIETDEGDFYEINSGTFKVMDNGNAYELEFSGATFGGTEFSGFYKGSLMKVDFDQARLNVASGDKERRFFNKK